MRTLLSLAALLLITVVFAPLAAAQDPPMEENSAPFMQAKLRHSQAVLEGLTTEDYDQIAKSAQSMSLLSQAAQWQVIQTPEYVRRSADFRREADALKEAAVAKNLDRATLAFLKVTMNCIDCHKYVRSVGNASLEAPEFLKGAER